MDERLTTRQVLGGWFRWSVCFDYSTSWYSDHELSVTCCKLFEEFKFTPSLLYFSEMTLPWCRVLVVVIVAVSDVAVYIYDIYLSGTQNGKPIGYAAHISGAIAGLFVGILVLRNLRWEKHERYIWAFSFSLFVLLIGSAIIWSIAVPSHFSGIRHKVNITCISANIL